MPPAAPTTTARCGASATVPAPVARRLPPSSVSAAAALPSAASAATASTPPATVVPPLWPLLPPSVSVPLPCLCRAPLPVKLPSKRVLPAAPTRNTWPTARATDPLPLSAPACSLASTSSVPPAITSGASSGRA